MPSRVVQHSKELDRILALPRRRWPDALVSELVARLTAELRTPTGTWTLKPLQAITLAEARVLGGAFPPLPVGYGKTLISALLPTVLQADRPVLLVPANLRDKTLEKDFPVLRKHWRISPAIQVISYEMLGREQHAERLKQWKPDLLICDEAHRLKNHNAAVTKRVLRTLKGGNCRFVAMSGTMTRRSLKDFAHLLAHALGADATPVPTETWRELEDWASALDETKSERLVDVGALRALCGPEEADITDPLLACRRAFRRRLVDTPGVIATEEEQLGVSLQLTRVAPPVPRAVRAALEELAEDWVLPDGQTCADGARVWQHARELALGFFYRWDPAPPVPWLEARRSWHSACREILTDNRTHLDSELQVIRAIDAFYEKPRPVEACTCAELAKTWRENLKENGPPSCSHCGEGEPPTCPSCEARASNERLAVRHRISPEMYHRGARPLARWRAIKASFTPNTVPVWIDEFAVDYVVARAKAEPMLVWVEHRAFAAALEARGLQYYGAKGRNRAGQMIEDAEPTRSVALSIASNVAGRNLQKWSRNLVTSPPASGLTWEQLIGRTHRTGQLADEVAAHWLATCGEHDQSMAQAVQDAHYVAATTGSPQKLLLADAT